MPERQPHDILGVRPQASLAEVQIAFRRLAMQWHPDRCHLPEAAEKFREVHDAYHAMRQPAVRATSVPRHRESADPCCPELDWFWRDLDASLRVEPEALTSFFARVEAGLKRVFRPA